MSSVAVTRDWILQPASVIRGDLQVPGDKSISHRALMLGGCAEGVTEVRDFLASEDCLATLAALRAMGVRIEGPDKGRVLIHGAGAEAWLMPPAPLDMGNSGTALRLLMGLLAAQPFDSSLVGDSSLMRRPMERVAAPLRQMGARIETRDGRPPIVIRGGAQLRAIDFHMPVASAQVKSAVLLAALQASGRTHVHEPAPTRDHTERMFSAFGVEVLRHSNTVSLEGGQALRATELTVPGDFSSAAFFLVAASIAGSGEVRLRNVGVNPTRTGLLDILLKMGADIRIEKRRAVGGEPVADLVVGPARLRGVQVPPELVPLAIDEFPVFFIAAACAEGPSTLRGAEELRVKESDRLAVMSAGLTELAVPHELLADGMWLAGREPGAAVAAPVFQGGSIDSHGDHRIAMAFAVASLRAAGEVRVRDVANVATSFPGFADIVRGLGLRLQDIVRGATS
jgi:3-phosphoshikimate 1-carboxyvinyltransferase